MTAFTAGGGETETTAIIESASRRSDQAKKKNLLTAVKIRLPGRNVHRPPQKTIFPGECCHQAAVAAGAGLPLLLVLWQAWPREQQHVGQSPAHQYVRLQRRGTRKVSAQASNERL